MSTFDTVKYFPAIAGDGSGGAFIVWEDHRDNPATGNGNIYVQKVDVNGTQLLLDVNGKPSDKLVSKDDASAKRVSNIVKDGAGGAFVVWEDDRNGVGNTDIYMQKIDAGGNPVWGADLVVCSAAGNQFTPKMALANDNTGDVIIVWEDHRSANSSSQIYAQRFDKDGNPMWALDGIAVSPTTSNQIAPALTTDGYDGAVIVWEDQRNSLTGSDIYGQRIDSSGVGQWGFDGKAVTNAFEDQWFPAVATDSQNHFVVTWEDYRNDPVNFTSDIFAKGIDYGGSTVFDDVAVSQYAQDQRYPQVAFSKGENSFIISWEDYRNDLYTTDIYAQKIDASNGVPLWSSDGMPISAANDIQDAVSITSSDAQGVIATWEDFRSGNVYDIYAVSLSYPGSITIGNGSGSTNIVNVTLNLWASSAGNPISEMRFSNDNVTWSSWEPYSATKGWTLTPGIGLKTVYVQFRDSALNVSPIYYDKTIYTYVLTGAISINGGAPYTTSTYVNLSISATNASWMCISFDTLTCDSWMNFSTSKTDWPIPNKDGIRTAYVKFKDANNNISDSFSSTIFLDANAPVTTPSPLGGNYILSQSVTLTCNDGTGSGCSKIYYTTDGTTPTTGSSQYSGQISISSSTTLQYFAVDVAGNVEAVKSQTYSIIRYLTATKTGTGTGAVNSLPAGIACGASCNGAFNLGATVALTANPDPSSNFTGWSGACSGTGSCSVAMTSNSSVTAGFAIKTFTIDGTSRENGTITPSSQTINYGSTISFTVTPSTGYHIESVTGCGGTLSGNTYTTGQITGDCSVTASFSINTYNVTGTAGGNGTITPSPQTISYGGTASFTVTPSTGYHISSVAGCGGTLSGNTYTSGQIIGDCSVSASFAINSYTVTGTPNGYGTITLSPQTINYGSTASFTVTPNSGYSIISVTGCNGTLSGNTYTTAAVTADCSVIANFTTALNTYTVTGTSGGNGTITPSSQTISYGSTASFTVAPDQGYHIASVTGCGGTLSGNTYTTGTITADCSITANFAINSYTVTAAPDGNGTIGPSPQTISYGSTASFTVTPSTGYQIVSVTGCGGTLNVNTYTTAAATANCGITASFSISNYTITPSTATNGSILPSTPQTVSYNGTASFTIVPSAGYHITSVSGCGGSLNVNTNTYTTGAITGDCSISASFSINNYTVTPSADANGSISPSTPQTVSYNGTTSFTVTPGTGYRIASVTGCGGTLGGNTYMTGSITGDCSVSASFAINNFTVTPSAGANGSISPSSPQTASYNGTASFTVTPGTGYHITSVTGCDGTLNGNTYTTGSITGDCSVSASFAINTLTISVTEGNNGSIPPSSNVLVDYGSSQSFTIAPNTGYHVADVLVDGISVGAVTTYPFNNVTAGHTLSASFAINVYTISPSAGSNGSISPSGNVTANYGSSQSFTIAPNTGYHVADVLVDGVSIGAVTTHTFNNVTTGHTISASFAATTNSDTTPPTGSITINNGATYTNSMNVTAALSASDAGTGVAGMTFSGAGDPVDSRGGWLAYSMSEGIVLHSGDGSKTVSVQFKDAAGNPSPTYSATISLDTTKPSSSITSPLSGSLIGNVATYNIIGTAADAGSGIQKVEISTDGGATWSLANGTTSWSYSWSVPSDASYTIVSRSTDNAGNVETAGGGITVTVDKTAPQAVITGTPASPTNSGNATFTVSGTGVVSYKYKLDAGAYSSETADATNITLSSLSDGVHNLYVIGKDVAGNWQGEANATFATWTVDTTPPGPGLGITPVVTLDGAVAVSGQSTYSYSKVVASWTSLSDAVAGLKEYKIAIGTTAGGSDVLNWASTGTATSYTGADISGSYFGKTMYFNVKAVDQLGNESNLLSVSFLYTPADINSKGGAADGRVDGFDLGMLGIAFGGTTGGVADINRDGKVDGDDLIILGANFGKVRP